MMLIVFEGLDGVGKSTVINGVAKRLNAKRMRTPPPLLNEARKKCASLSTRAEEALFDLGNMMASDEMQREENQLMICDRYAISTDVRRIVSRHNNQADILEEIFDWEWPKHLYRPLLNIHLCVNEKIRQQRVRLRGNMTLDEKRLETDAEYRTAILIGYSEMCDITLDLTGLDEDQAVNSVMAYLRNLFHRVDLNPFSDDSNLN